MQKVISTHGAGCQSSPLFASGSASEQRLLKTVPPEGM
jgi:hypothetical protein